MAIATYILSTTKTIIRNGCVIKLGSSKWRRRRRRLLENNHERFISCISKLNIFVREFWNLSPVSWGKIMIFLLKTIMRHDNFLHFIILKDVICYILRASYIVGLFLIFSKRILYFIFFRILRRLFRRMKASIHFIIFLVYGLQFLLSSFVCGYNVRDFSIILGYTNQDS